MDDVVLEQDASHLLVQIGRSIETWILKEALQRAQKESNRVGGPIRIDTPHIQMSLSELMRRGLEELEQVRDGTDIASRRAS